MGIRLTGAGPVGRVRPLVSAENPFCELLAGVSSETRRCPGWCEARRELAAGGGPRVSRCGVGLMHLTAPVVRDGMHVATLEGGQVFCRRPVEGDFDCLLGRFPGWREADLSRLRAAYFATPVLAPKQWQAAVTLFEGIGQALSLELLRQVAAGTGSGSGHIERARAFIAAHLAEAITMRQAARHVRLCPSYFCRLFKRENGRTFFSYVARARVERAQRLLRCSSRPITEIGYAAGFQSLWHFNHVFKKYTGLTPTQYRAGRAEAGTASGEPAKARTPNGAGSI